jgi:phospholipase/carboxylesterase
MRAARAGSTPGSAASLGPIVLAALRLLRCRARPAHVAESGLLAILCTAPRDRTSAAARAYHPRPMASETTKCLPCVEVEPRGAARAAVIWLHGLGADGHDFEPIVPHLGLDPALGVRFVFPHAPRMPVSINMGLVMPAWYDIRDLSPKARHDEAGIRRAANEVEKLIARENARGLPCERIVLAGFSQGGAIAMHVALRSPEKLAGLAALSSYLVLADELERERSDANLALPIFIAHGTYDPMVPYDRGVASCEKLRALGYRVDFRSYPMQHEVCLEEIQAVGEFLAAALA